MDGLVCGANGRPDGWLLGVPAVYGVNAVGFAGVRADVCAPGLVVMAYPVGAARQILLDPCDCCG